MKIKLLGDTKCPERKRDGDCGWDLYLNDYVYLPKHSVTVIDTGVCVEIPEGYVGLLAMRSSVCKTGLTLQNPLIDRNYRGELHILIANNTDNDFNFEKKDRICSLYCFPYLTESLEVVDELSESNRGKNWNGSSGK